MTQPPGDSWRPPQTSTTQASSSAAPLDAWGRPLLDFDPGANQATLARASARLHTWLGALLLVFLVSGVASALGLFFGGQAGLKALASLGGAQQPLPAVTGWLLGLAALLSLALTALYVGVIAWARELLSRLGIWGLSAPQAPAPDAVRIEKLRRTLAGWLTFGQWGTVVGVLFSTALVPITLHFTQQLAERFGPTASGGFDGFGLGFATLQTISSLVSSLPGVVIVWLILGAIRRFMNLAALRARGLATAPVTPAAKTVSNWFLLCLILLGLELLYLVLIGLGTGVGLAVVSGQLSSSDAFLAGLSGVLAWAVPLLVGVLIWSALVLGLYFALLFLSRTYALALARQVDLAPTPSAPPVNVLPTGSAGENPNIYRGQL